MCATLEFKSNTWSHAFQTAGEIALAWKKHVTESDLLYVRTIICFVDSHKKRTSSRNAIYTAKISSDKMVELCKGKDCCSERHKRIGFLLRLDFLVWMILNRESIARVSDAHISVQDKLFHKKRLFYCSSASLAERFVYWIKFF